MRYHRRRSGHSFDKLRTKKAPPTPRTSGYTRRPLRFAFFRARGLPGIVIRRNAVRRTRRHTSRPAERSPPPASPGSNSTPAGKSSPPIRSCGRKSGHSNRTNPSPEEEAGDRESRCGIDPDQRLRGAYPKLPRGRRRKNQEGALWRLVLARRDDGFPNSEHRRARKSLRPNEEDPAVVFPISAFGPQPLPAPHPPRKVRPTPPCWPRPPLREWNRSRAPAPRNRTRNPRRRRKSGHWYPAESRFPRLRPQFLPAHLRSQCFRLQKLPETSFGRPRGTGQRYHFRQFIPPLIDFPDGKAFSRSRTGETQPPLLINRANFHSGNFPPFVDLVKSGNRKPNEALPRRLIFGLYPAGVQSEGKETTCPKATRTTFSPENWPLNRNPNPTRNRPFD